jgi:hypothetical protein
MAWTLAAATHEHGGGAVAKQRSRDDVAFREIVAAEGEGAQFDNEQKHGFARHRRCHIGGARQTNDPAGASQTEDRQPREVARQLHALNQQRVEARSRDAGGRYGDDAAEFIDAPTRAVESLTGNAFQKIECARNIATVTLGPAMRLVVPFERHRRVAPVDTAIREHGQQTVEDGRPAEQPLDPLDDFLLTEHIGRHGGGQGQQPRRERHRAALRFCGENETTAFSLVLELLASASRCRDEKALSRDTGEGSLIFAG